MTLQHVAVDLKRFLHDLLPGFFGGPPEIRVGPRSRAVASGSRGVGGHLLPQIHGGQHLLIVRLVDVPQWEWHDTS